MSLMVWSGKDGFKLLEWGLAVLPACCSLALATGTQDLFFPSRLLLAGARDPDYD